jgi:hypothetical protein
VQTLFPGVWGKGSVLVGDCELSNSFLWDLVPRLLFLCVAEKEGGWELPFFLYSGDITMKGKACALTHKSERIQSIQNPQNMKALQHLEILKFHILPKQQSNFKPSLV